MYPDFRYLLHSLTGLEMPQWLGLFKTFGLMVAMAFFAAAWATAEELKRKEKAGLLKPQSKTMIIGQKVSIVEVLLAALTGFVLAFKIGGVFGHVEEVSPDPMGYLLSPKGNLIIGIIGLLAMGIQRYYEGKKQELPAPETRTILVHPHELIMEIVIVAAIGGFAGAKIFNALETWDDFIKDPIGNLTSSSGLTFLGGLIVATASLYFYGKKQKIPFKHMADAAAPGILLAYGIGRIGCQLAGDGDWGIYNMAYVSNPDGTLRQAIAADKADALRMIAGSPYTYCKAPSWLPDWIVAMNYPHNVGNVGRAIAGCTGDFCTALPVSVFPTPIYESISCILLFFVLWRLRFRLLKPLQVFGAYLVLSSAERFLVELIRVNTKYNLGFIQPTQAELISVILFCVGIWLVFGYKDKEPVAQPAEATAPLELEK